MWGTQRVIQAVVLAAATLSGAMQGGGGAPNAGTEASAAFVTAAPVDIPSTTGNVGLVVKPGNQTMPDLGGRFLAWQDDNGAVSQVYLMDLVTLEQFAAWPSPVRQVYPRLHDGLLSFVEWQKFNHTRCSDWCTLLVWPESRTTRHVDADSPSMAVTTDTHIVQTGGIVMPGGTERIYGRLLSNGSRDLELRGGSGNWLAAADDWVALGIRPYSDDGGSYYCPSGGEGGLDPCVTELGVVFPGNRTTVVLTNSRSQYYGTGDPEWNWQCLHDFTREEYPSALGSTVYWQDNRNSDFAFDPVRCTWSGEQWDIYAFDVASGTEVAVRTAPWNETRPDVDENLLIWADDRSGDWDIYAQFLDTGEEVRLTDDPATQKNPTASNGCVAWEDNRNGDWDIYGRCLLEPSLSGGRSPIRRDPPEEWGEVAWNVNRTVTRTHQNPFEARVRDPAIPFDQAGMDLAATSVEKNRTASRARSSVAS